MSVKIADIIQPEAFIPAVQIATTQGTVLFQSGIVNRSPVFDAFARQPGLSNKIPFFGDLADDEAEVLSDTVPLSIGKITTGKQTYVKQGYGRAWGANALAGELMGDNPLQRIANRVGAYWARFYQKVLQSTCEGIFKGDQSLRDTNSLIIATENPPVWSKDTLDDPSFLNEFQFMDATSGVLGDRAGDLTTMVVHSAVYNRLVKADMIKTHALIAPSGQQVNIPTYLNRVILQDDTMPNRPVTTGGNNGRVFTTYLFGRGVVNYGEGAPTTPAETGRYQLLDEDYFINRRHFIFHPDGVGWQGTIVGDFPTRAELAASNAWKRILDPKLIRIVQIIHN